MEKSEQELLCQLRGERQRREIAVRFGRLQSSLLVFIRQGGIPQLLSSFLFLTKRLGLSSNKLHLLIALFGLMSVSYAQGHSS